MNAGRSSFPTCGITAALIGGLLAVDWWLPVGFAASVLYVVPVFVSSWIPLSRAVPLTAATVSLLTFLDLTRTSSLTPAWVVISNQFFSLVVIWVTAILCMRRQQDEQRLRIANENIEQQVETRTAELAQMSKKLDALRAEAASQLAAIVTSSDDAIIGKTLNGIILSWNTGAERHVHRQVMVEKESANIPGRFHGPAEFPELGSEFFPRERGARFDFDN